MEGTQTGHYALAALDMDGTLLNTAHELTPYTREVLARAAGAEKVLALCTGRCLSELWEHFQNIPGIAYAICENGGCLYDVRAGRKLYQYAIPAETANAILDISGDYDVCVQCFIDGQSCMQIADVEALRPYHIYDYAGVFTAGSRFVRDARALLRAGGSVEKINLYFADPAQKAEFARRAAPLDLFVADSLGFGCEISPREATKAAGLKRLCDRLGLKLSESLAVGDGGNDVDLMRAAGLGVAMGNAAVAVKAAADAVTEDCDHDGAAKAIARYMLGERV